MPWVSPEDIPECCIKSVCMFARALADLVLKQTNLMWSSAFSWLQGYGTTAAPAGAQERLFTSTRS